VHAFGAAFVSLSWAAVAVGQAPVQYSLDEAGRVSVAVYDTQGRQVRTLSSGAAQDAGRHTLTWDGLDWTGRPAPAGEYEWRLLSGPGLKSEFLLKVGTPLRELPWPNNHNGPYQMAVCGDLLFIKGSGEVVPAQVAVDLRDGTPLHYRGMNGDVLAGGPGRLATLGHNGVQLHTLVDNVPTKATERDVHVQVARHEVPPVSELERVAEKKPVEVDEVTEGMLDELNPVTEQPPPKPVSVAVPPGRYTVRLDLDVKSQYGRVHVWANDAAGRFQKVRTEDVSPKKSRIALEAVEAVGGRVQVAVEPTDAQRTRCDLKSVTVQDDARLLSMLGEKLAVGFPGTGRIEWLATSPELPTEGKAIVPDLKGIALRPDGLVIAISGSSLVEVAANQPPVTRVTDLPNPILIAADAKSGGVFVVSGEGTWQVRRYDRDWKLTGTFGRAGGRQTGLYHPGDFKNIRSLTADGQGGFLVLENECAPRRVARFDATGTLVQEWNGGQLFFTLASGDPGNPSRVWLNSHWGWMMETEVDYDARTWKPRATYVNNGLFGGLFNSNHLGVFGTLRRFGEHRFIVRNDHPRMLVVDEERGMLRPVMAHGAGDAPALIKAWLGEANVGRPKNDQLQSFLWQDANGDGQPQREEVSFGGSVSGRWAMDDAFNWYCCTASGDKRVVQKVWRLPVLRWEAGRPVYAPLDNLEGVAEIPVADEFRAARRTWGPLSIGIGDDGAIYEVFKGGGEGFTADFGHTSHTWLWPTGLWGEMGFSKWSAARGLEWRVGSMATGGGYFVPGQLDDPLGVLGRHAGMVLLANRVVMPLQAWTEDGLFAGGMFDRRADDGLPEKFYKWWRGLDRDGKVRESPISADMMTGGSFVSLPDGDGLYFAAGWNDAPVYRVSGWKDFQRQSGRITLAGTPAAASGRGTGLSAEYFGTKAAGTAAPVALDDPDPEPEGDTGADALLAEEIPETAPIPAEEPKDVLTGTPALSRVDPLIWFGNSDTKVNKPWPEPALTKGPFAARWTGSIEPRFSEPYFIKVYRNKSNTTADRVRVWLDGKLILDGWDGKGRGQLWSRPIPLVAGRKVPVRVEFEKAAGGNLHLCWESLSQEIEHIPTAFLYPEPAPVNGSP
jgi:hypothetical protein